MSIARMIWKRKLVILLVWLAGSAITYLYVNQIPSLYRSEALILVDSQKIPDRYVSSTISIDIQDRLTGITQQILSSTRLEKLIEEFDLYPDRGSAYPEELVMRMRRDIAVRPEKGWSTKGPGAFRIGYSGTNRVKVAQVTNRIANLFIEENLKTREIQASGTSEFIEAQLGEAKKRLDDLESTVSNYKTAHIGELPQQEMALIGTVGRLQGQYEGAREAINRAEQSTVLLENTLSTLEATVAARAQAKAQAKAQAQAFAAQLRDAQAARDNPGVAVQPGPKASEILRQQVATLLLKYSETHPEVRRMQASLDKMLEQEAAQAEAVQQALQNADKDKPKNTKPNTTGAPTPQVAAAPVDTADVEMIQLQDKINAVKAQITFARAESQKRKDDQERILREIAVYQTRIDRLPQREQEMARVTRDYEISKANYKSLLDKKLAADMSADMERRQKSERFTLADPARVAELPFKPNRRAMYGTGTLIALALGVILGLALELKRNTILGEWELPPGVVVLGTLPIIRIDAPGESGPAGWMRRRRASAVVSTVLVVAASATYVLVRTIG